MFSQVALDKDLAEDPAEDRPPDSEGALVGEIGAVVGNLKDEAVVEEFQTAGDGALAWNQVECDLVRLLHVDPFVRDPVATQAESKFHRGDKLHEFTVAVFLKDAGAWTVVAH